MRTSLKTYESALRKARDAQFTSNVETDGSVETDLLRSKRSRNPPKRYHYLEGDSRDESSEEETASQPPPKKRHEPNAVRAASEMQPTSNCTLPVAPTNYGFSDTDIPMQLSSYNSSLSGPLHNSVQSNGCQRLAPSSQSSSVPSSVQAAVLVAQREGSNIALSNAVLEKLFHALETMQHRQKELTKEMRSLKICMEEIKGAITGKDSVELNTLVNVHDFNFLPCKTDDDVEKLERCLRNTEKRNQFIKILYRCGGGSMKEAVRLMMNKTLDCHQATKYSYKGKQKKRPFSSLLVNSAMIEAVKHLFESESEFAISQAIGSKLAQANITLQRQKSTILDSKDGHEVDQAEEEL